MSSMNAVAFASMPLFSSAWYLPAISSRSFSPVWCTTRSLEPSAGARVSSASATRRFKTCAPCDPPVTSIDRRSSEGSFECR